MAENQYMIVETAVDPQAAVNGLTGLTLEQAEAWMLENNSENKFSIEKDNWPESL